ncbi:hypothetical protein OC846_002566 [Tilletia horrida]|uniref:deoxyribose-phosphate aldolase n=1 Tax=Tilletia horrida TaxID=155126 RepID=A0AAN6GTV2_9BASI|nr:hypothetical protein OC845_003442 [Tilletia horrida]KAK0553323.1 hypothetical protein OC846_002566 [Tilletia horrida]KAK0567708.1 hypothetical protein OC861_002562 [Tilletia horrida]
MASAYNDPQLHGLVRTMLKQMPASFINGEDEDKTKDWSTAALLRTIDHTLLTQASPMEIITLCTTAHRAQTATVCVNSNMIPFAVASLQQIYKDASPEQQQQHRVVPIAVVGFPFGASNTAGKVAETIQAIQDGAQEIDMVVAISYLRAGLYSYVLNDISAVVQAARSARPSAAAAAEIPVKVILETANLTTDQIATSSLLACLAGAAFIKTSTGYAQPPLLEGRPLGARVEDVRLMAWVTDYHHQTFLSEAGSAQQKVKVKASGGIGSAAALRQMLNAGANRIGASRTETIAKELISADATGSSSDASAVPAPATAPSSSSSSSDAY